MTQCETRLTCQHSDGNNARTQKCATHDRMVHFFLTGSSWAFREPCAARPLFGQRKQTHSTQILCKIRRRTWPSLHVSNNSIEPLYFRITAAFVTPGSALPSYTQLDTQTGHFPFSKANTKKQTNLHVSRRGWADNGLLFNPSTLFTHFKADRQLREQ